MLRHYGFNIEKEKLSLCIPVNKAMGSKENFQSEIISAWAISALQAMDECPEGGLEVLEQMAKRIMLGIFESGQDIPLGADEYVDMYDVPEVVFEIAENDPGLLGIGKRMKALSPECQKLLHFIVKGLDPKLVSEAMEFSDPVEYWEKREDCLKEFVGQDMKLSDDLKNKLLKVYDKYEKIRDNFLYNTDIIVKRRSKSKSKRRWIITALIAAFIPCIFFLFVYPRLIQKDFRVLFDYGVERSGFVMTIDSTGLLEDMILEEEQYTPESYWLQALKSLQEGDSEGCREQLKALKSADRNLFNDRGRYIYRRLR